MDREQTGEDSLEPRQNNDMEFGNAVATRKVLKADREKLRRDKLNEQFLELGNLLDPDRPKNDKGTIVSDTIQVLRDLNSEVKKLKQEHALFCEESHELTQEKNEIREEKASLKSDIQNLTAQQHQQTRGFMVPWDSQIVMAPPYPFPVALPMHQAIQPPPLLASLHSASSTYIPYLAPVMPRADQPAALNASASYVSGPRASKAANSNDVATDLELKVPGSAAPKESSAREKGKQHQEKPTNGSVDDV